MEFECECECIPTKIHSLNHLRFFLSVLLYILVCQSLSLSFQLCSLLFGASSVSSGKMFMDLSFSACEWFKLVFESTVWSFSNAFLCKHMESKMEVWRRWGSGSRHAMVHIHFSLRAFSFPFHYALYVFVCVRIFCNPVLLPLIQLFAWNQKVCFYLSHSF